MSPSGQAYCVLMCIGGSPRDKIGFVPSTGLRTPFGRWVCFFWWGGAGYWGKSLRGKKLR